MEGGREDQDGKDGKAAAASSKEADACVYVCMYVLHVALPY